MTAVSEPQTYNNGNKDHSAIARFFGDINIIETSLCQEVLFSGALTTCSSDPAPDTGGTHFFMILKKHK